MKSRSVLSQELKRKFFSKTEKGQPWEENAAAKSSERIIDCVRFRSLQDLSAINKNMTWHCDKGNRGQEQYSMRGINEAN